MLGHGTQRNAGSARTVHAQAAHVRATGRFAQVTAVFTDQNPGVTAIGALAGGREATVVPFFAAEGWHVGQVAGAGGMRGIRYTAPAGTHPAMADVIAELAREAERW